LLIVLTPQAAVCRQIIPLTWAVGCAQLATVKEIQKKVKSLLKANPLPKGYLVPALAPEDDPEQILQRQFLYLTQAQTIRAIHCQFELPWKIHPCQWIFYSQGDLTHVQPPRMLFLLASASLLLSCPLQCVCPHEELYSIYPLVRHVQSDVNIDIACLHRCPSFSYTQPFFSTPGFLHVSDRGSLCHESINMPPFMCIACLVSSVCCCLSLL
jgi:hypothetical protein